jgi:hypothetical protein
MPSSPVSGLWELGPEAACRLSDPLAFRIKIYARPGHGPARLGLQTARHQAMVARVIMACQLYGKHAALLPPTVGESPPVAGCSGFLKRDEDGVSTPRGAGPLHSLPIAKGVEAREGGRRA